MSKQTPYLQRRGDTFSFRIAVPSELRQIIGKREYIKSLHTTDKRIAIPMALRLAATAKQLFNEIPRDMSKPSRLRQPISEKMSERLPDDEEHLVEGEGLRIDYSFEIDLDEFRSPKRIRVQAEPHEQDAVNSAIKTALEHAQASSQQSAHPDAASTIKNASEARKTDPMRLLSMVIDDFLEKYQRNKHPDMFKKHKQVLPMFLEIIGNKPINELKQANINAFFELLGMLPPRWTDECRKRKLSIKELAELEHSEILGPKTFKDTYKACVRSFLITAKKDWQDQGFPTTLTTEGIKYRGDREEGEKAQRAFTLTELKRLFKGREMESFTINPAQAHYHWLPHIGLFTGARVNEICQLNPQVDILQEEKTGIWYFWITEETDGDDRIHKSTKNKTSRRKVPIHSALKKLGFLEYAERVKKQGAKLLFPAWKPVRGKASGQAEKWFRQLIKDTGLRDDTPYARIVGMHAFRNTLLNRASNANPPINAESITGHAGEKSAVVRGYEGELTLENKSRALEAIPFGISF